MVQDSKVSFEYVDFYTKMSLILDAAFGNQKTKRTLLFIGNFKLHLRFVISNILVQDVCLAV